MICTSSHENAHLDYRGYRPMYTNNSNTKWPSIDINQNILLEEKCTHIDYVLTSRDEVLALLPKNSGKAQL